MLRTVFAGLIGIAALLSTSLAVISWVTGDGAPASSDRSIAQASPAALQPSPVPASSAPTPYEAPAPLPAVAAAADTAAAMPVAPPITSKQQRAGLTLPVKSREQMTTAPAEMPAQRHKSLRDFRLGMKAGVASLQELVSPCPIVDASFSLALESVAEGVRVVSASPESPGVADEVGVACVQSALRGRVIPASIEPGKRWQMSLAVNPST